MLKLIKEPLLTLFISPDAKTVLCSQNVTVDLIDVLIEDNQLHSDVNQEINTGI